MSRNETRVPISYTATLNKKAGMMLGLKVRITCVTTDLKFYCIGENKGTIFGLYFDYDELDNLKKIGETKSEMC